MVLAQYANVAYPLSWFLYRFMVHNDSSVFALPSFVQSEALTKKILSKFYVSLTSALWFLKVTHLEGFSFVQISFFSVFVALFFES